VYREVDGYATKECDENKFFDPNSRSKAKSSPNPPFSKEGDTKAPPFAKGGWEGFAFDFKKHLTSVNPKTTKPTSMRALFKR
jgi:hypothetical protein